MINKILSLFIYLTIGACIIACGDDDDKKRKVEWPKEIKDSKVYKTQLLVSADAVFGIPIAIKLEDFNKLENLKNEVLDAEINATSYIKFTGVSLGGHKLRNLKLRIKDTNIERDFDIILKDGIYRSIKTDLNFLDFVASRLANRKECILLIEGISDKKILEEVEVEINLDILFLMKQ